MWVYSNIKLKMFKKTYCYQDNGSLALLIADQFGLQLWWDLEQLSQSSISVNILTLEGNNSYLMYSLLVVAIVLLSANIIVNNMLPLIQESVTSAFLFTVRWISDIHKFLTWGVWREVARLASRPCRRRRPSSPRWRPEWEGSLGGNGYMYMYGWVPLLSTWNYHNIVNWL